MYSDLPSFLRDLERAGDLDRVSVEVDPHLEVTEIVTRVVRRDGPAILFERVKGSPFPVVANLLGARRRIVRALGREPGEVGAELVALLERLQPPTLAGLWRSRGTLRRLLAMRTSAYGAAAPAQEVDEEPALDRFPALHCWPGDAGRFLTLPLVLTEGPTGAGGAVRRNVGVYRMQIFDAATTGMHWQIAKGGGYHHHAAERAGRPSLPVAVVLGADPCLVLAAVAPLPEGLDELAFAGFLRGRPTAVARARTVPLDVPAHAELVLEGEVPAGERRDEGPFGDHFGHYSHRQPFPVFRVKRVTRKTRPVLPVAVVGKPPQEDAAMGDAVQEMLLPLLRTVLPEVRDLWAYGEAGFHSLCVCSVRERYRKEAMKTALGLLGQGQMALTKVVIVVDEDVDARDFEAVVAAIGSQFDPAEDFLLVPGVPFDTLDFTSFRPNLGSKMVLDATRGQPAGGPGRTADTPPPGMPDLAAIPGPAVSLGGALVAFRSDAARARADLEAAIRDPRLGAARIVVAVSDDVQLDDRRSLLWGIFTRFDPARDVFFERVELRGAWALPRGRMAIDATFKPGYPPPVEMDPDVVRMVNDRWHDYFPA